MKTRSRFILRRFGGLMLSVAMLTGMECTEVMATELNSIESSNVGTAEVMDSVSIMAEEPAEVAASDEDREEAQKELKKVMESEEKQYTLVMADVNEYLSVRQEPSADSAKIGVLYADCGGTILEKRSGWTKIQSGNLIGWAKNEYLLFGENAQQKALEVGIYKATVTGKSVRIRKEPNTGAGIWVEAERGDVYPVIIEQCTNGWIAVEYSGVLGYISANYVSMEFTVDHGETNAEIQERERKQKQDRQQLIVKEGASAIGVTDDVLLAALIYYEAGNQSYEGQVAVGAVVMNRVKSGAYPNTIAGVIYASGQFTPVKTGKVEELAMKGVNESCLKAARAAMNGESPVGNATHFRRVGNKQGQIIGDHVFW